MNKENAQVLLNEIPRMREDLPFSPEVLKRLFAQTASQSNASIEDVAQTLNEDQGLVTRILSLANSAYYGLQAEVQSVSRAAAVLGMKEIRNIVLTLGVSGLTSHYSLSEDFDMVSYWKHQFLVGMIAKELAQMSGVGHPDTLFTIGLLHDIGKLITALLRPEDSEAIQELAEGQSLPDVEAEDMYWGLDHAVVGSLVLRAWDLPSGLCEPVNWHHAPELSPEHSNESTLMALADCIAHAVEDPETSCVDRAKELCSALEVDYDEVIEMAEDQLDSKDTEQFIQQLT